MFTLTYPLVPLTTRFRAPSASRTRSVPSIVAQCAISFFHIITELRDLRVELQFHFLRRTVALFGDDQFSKPEHAFHLHRPFGVIVKGAGFITIHRAARSEEHTSELQSLMRNSYAVF